MAFPELPEGLTGADFYAVAENSPDFVALACLDNTVAYVNPAGRALVGLASLEEATAHAITDYLTPDGLRASTAIGQPAVIEHGFWQGRSTLRHFRTGRAIPVEVTSYLVRDPDTGIPASSPPSSATSPSRSCSRSGCAGRRSSRRWGAWPAASRTTSTTSSRSSWGTRTSPPRAATTR